MIERFSGSGNRRLLIQELRHQPIVEGDLARAEALADSVTLAEVPAGTAIIAQDGHDNDLYFILAGSFSVRVHGREVARRTAREHVGEMAVISPSARRSASVAAVETSVVARISEGAFSELAEHHPALWRALADRLAARLRERNGLVRPLNEVPHLFVGSSAELRAIAREIQSGLARDPVVVQVWTDRVFTASATSIEALEIAAAKADFAVLVLGADDIVQSRDTEKPAPRDNVVFELGLFMGNLGRGRTFAVVPEKTDLKIPTDLLGVTMLTYRTGAAGDLESLIGPVCNEIRKKLAELGPR